MLTVIDEHRCYDECHALKYRSCLTLL